MAMLLVSAGAATGQTTGGPVTPNFKDVDLTEIAKAVSAATGKNIIVDSRIHDAHVTMISSTAMPSAAFYEAFLSLARVYCLVAKTDGNVVKILPDPKVSSCSPAPH